MAPELYPSIDLRGGRVVRLRQGDYGRETVYDVDPVTIATQFAVEGAGWVHLVDLDAARDTPSANRPTIAAIAGTLAGRARVQVGGGVRTVADAVALAEVGVSRVVMGSAAVAEPQLIDEVAGHVAVAVALDHRGGVVAVRGWTQASDLALVDGLACFPSAAAFVITDIGRDGELSGPDVDGIGAAVAATSTPIIASGGVASLDDLRALSAIPGLQGIITGRALYEHRFTVAEAVSVLEEA